MRVYVFHVPKNLPLLSYFIFQRARICADICVSKILDFVHFTSSSGSFLLRNPSARLPISGTFVRGTVKSTPLGLRFMVDSSQLNFIRLFRSQGVRLCSNLDARTIIYICVMDFFLLLLQYQHQNR